MSETERTVIGACQKLEEGKNGWYTVLIDVAGKQYPVKAQTKITHLLDEARRIRDAGLIATWTIKDQPQFNEDGTEKINPNSGKQYVNHYLNSVEEGVQQATQTTPAGTQPVADAKHDALAYADEKRVISRQTCLKQASWVVAAMIANGMDIDQRGPAMEVIAQASQYEIWVYRDIDPLPSSEGGATGASERTGHSESAPPSDEYIPEDDVPF
jgi:hypothetical protein